MGQNLKVSKTVSDTVEGVLRKVVSAIKELDFNLENIDSRSGIVRFNKRVSLGAMVYHYQCVVFDMGDGSTMCTIQIVEYEGGWPWSGLMDSLGLMVSSRKLSQKILDRL